MKFLLLSLFLFSGLSTWAQDSTIAHSSCKLWITSYSMNVITQEQQTKMENLLKNKGYVLKNKHTLLSTFDVLEYYSYQDLNKGDLEDLLFITYFKKNQYEGYFKSLKGINKNILMDWIFDKTLNDPIKKVELANNYDDRGEEVYELAQSLPNCQKIKKTEIKPPKKKKVSEPVMSIIPQDKGMTVEHKTCRAWFFDSLYDQRNASGYLDKDKIKLLENKGYKLVNRFGYQSYFKLSSGIEKIKTGDLIITLDDKSQNKLFGKVFSFKRNLQKTSLRIDNHQDGSKPAYEFSSYDYLDEKTKRQAIESYFDSIPHCRSVDNDVLATKKKKVSNHDIREYEIRSCINKSEIYLDNNGKDKRVIDNIAILGKVGECENARKSGYGCEIRRLTSLYWLKKSRRKKLDNMIQGIGMSELSRITVDYLVENKICSSPKAKIDQIMILNVMGKALKGI